eukprot:1252584-Pyramimonas_sp.AAC.1
MSALGAELFDDWSGHRDLLCHLQRARRAWMCGVQFYRCRQLPMRDRYMRYIARVQPIVLYACEGMTADKGTIQKLYAWGGQLLAIIDGLRKKS